MDRLGLKCMQPEMDLFLLVDSWDMGIALVLLERTLDKGKYADTLQFQTARRLRSVYSNLWGASVYSMTSGVMAMDTINTYITKWHTYCVWFKQFVKGMHSRMGDHHRLDAVIMVKAMKGLMYRVNIDFKVDKGFYSRAGLLFMGALDSCGNILLT